MTRRQKVAMVLAVSVVSGTSALALLGTLTWGSRAGPAGPKEDDHVVELLVQRAREPEVAKREEEQRVAKPAGEALRVQKQQLDKEVAQNAGVLGATGDSQLSSGIGGLIGPKGTQIGAGGLGARGGGFGGGGTAESIGGFGTRGRGSGTGYGSGGGYFAGERVPVSYGAPMTGDAYKAIAENDFQAVADSPLSTFSVDVDTASYSNVRRYLSEGTAPPRDSVRIEELVNYFPYTYAPPTDGTPFATHAEVTAAPWAEGHRLVRIGIKGKEIDSHATPPRNLVFLVDVSGSMAGADRLPLVKKGLAMLTNQLGPEDHVAMVVYAGAAGTVLEPTRGDHTGEILSAIERLDAGGSTAGAAGIKAAYALAKENFREGAINRVILATDGDFNVGTSSDAELVQLIEEERKSGVFLSVLGVGRGNLQDAKMEQLADKGNGNYAYIDTFAEMRKVLGEQVGATLVTIAKDVKIQVEFNPAQVSSYRLLGYENRVLAARDFDDDTKDAGEIGAGHTVTALYEVVPANVPVAPEVSPLRYQAPREATTAAGSGELLTVKLRYKAPDRDVSKLLSFPVRDEGTAFAQASVDTRFAAAVAGFGMLLRDSPNKGAATWEWVADTAREALGADRSGYRGEFLKMIADARKIRG